LKISKNVINNNNNNKIAIKICLVAIRNFFRMRKYFGSETFVPSVEF
jgi:hypothetical protein